MKEFKLIVAGGRTYDDRTEMDVCIRETLAELPDDYVVTIVSGMANGADMLAYEWAKANGCKVISMPAKWKELGKRAGYVRNVDMAAIADGLLAFWDGKSKGTQHMITIAKTSPALPYIRVVHYGDYAMTNPEYTQNNIPTS